MGFRGEVVQRFFTSALLKGNRAGMTEERPVPVYLPPSAATAKNTQFPVLYCLAPWTNAGRTQFDWRPFKESLPDRLERLFAAGMPECVVVAPDLYTDFGGSQYIDSEYFGPHASHLVQELFPYIEQNFPVLPGAKHRGVFGRSSGGFGGLRLAMDFTGSVAAVACHSGDMGFDLLFGSDYATLAKALQRYGCDPNEFLDRIADTPKLSGRDVHVLMLLGCSGFYSPSAANLGFDLPIDLKTGALQNDVIEKWRTHDPVRRIEATHANLKKLSYLFIECGQRDQYNLLYGARQLRERLEEYDVKHEYAEFDDDHSGTDYRYDVSLPKMVQVLASG